MMHANNPECCSTQYFPILSHTQILYRDVQACACLESTPILLPRPSFTLEQM